MEQVAAGARRVLLGIWLGSVACFSFLVAPTLFRVLGQAPADRVSAAPRALAGDVVVPTLQALAWMGLVVGVLVVGLLGLDPVRKHMRWRVLGVGLGLLSVVVSMAWLTPTMLDLLQQMNGPVDALALGHPLRVRFDGLHKWSATVHMGMVLGPLLALALESGHSTR
jgi:hypothetical protein